MNWKGFVSYANILDVKKQKVTEAVRVNAGGAGKQNVVTKISALFQNVGGVQMQANVEIRSWLSVTQQGC